MQTNSLPKEIKTIAIFRANALGDFIFSTPMIRAIRAHFPKAKITYIGMDGHKSLIESRYPEIDEVLTLPQVSETEYISSKDWQSVHDFAKSLKGKFDVFLQVHDGSLEANTFARNAAAAYTIAFSDRPDENFDVVLPMTSYIHEVNRHLEVARLLGAPVVEYEPTMKHLDTDWSDLERHFDVDDRPIVILHPGAGDPRRRWPAANFASVGDWLAEHGYRVVITGTREEIGLAEDVLGLMKHDASCTAGRLSLAALIALMSVAKLFISNDTGPLHIARAIGLPTIGIYSPAFILHAGPMSVHTNRVLVSCVTKCPKCEMDLMCNPWDRYGEEPSKGTCTHDQSLVDDVKAEDCIELIQSMLK